MNIEKFFNQKNKNKKEKFEQEYKNLDFWLTSENIEALKELPRAERCQVVGRAVEYFLAFPTDSKLEVGELCFSNEMSKVDFYIEKTAELLNIADYEDKKAQTKILEYLFQKFVTEGNYYHAFNGNFLEDIKGKGLSNSERLWDMEKIKNIHSLLEKAGYKMAFGWFNLNSVEKLSISDYSDNIYKYAIASPEWFAQFVAEGWHIPNKKPYDKEAYYKGDYQAAKRNLNMFLDRLMSRSEEKIKKGMAYPNISREERDKILEFFDEHWSKFTGDIKPQVAVIKKSVIDKEMGDLGVDEYFANDEMSFISKVYNLIGNEYVDKQINYNIKPEDFAIIELPNYNEISPDRQ